MEKTSLNLIHKYKSIFILAILFAACNNINYNPDNYPKSPFVDLKAYFENEMKRSIKGPVEKITRVEGETKKSALDKIDLSKELKLFAEADLNKVSWFEKYKIDSTDYQPGKLKITYRALDEKLKTREVNIYESKGQIDSIYIHNKLESMIMDTDQYLRYNAKKGYSVSVEQVGKLQEGQNYQVEVRF